MAHDGPAPDSLAPGLRLVEWGTYALLFFAPLAVGTVHLASTAVVASGGALLLGALALVWTKPSRIALTPFGALLTLLTLYTGLQVVPLPAALVTALSPAAAALHRGAAALAPGVAAEPGWMTLSLAPGATWQSFMKLLGFLCLFLLAANYFGRESGRRRRLLAALVLSAVVTVALGFLNRLVFGEELRGLFAVEHQRFVGTFVNPNHMAGYLGLCVPVAMGMAVDARPAGKRLTVLWGAMLLAVGVFMTLSRGGIVAFVAGQVLLVWLLLTRRGQRSGSGLQVLWVPLVTLTVVGTSLWLAQSSLAAQAGTIIPVLSGSLGVEDLPPDVRVQVWTDSLSVMRDFPVTGIGSGAFAEVYAGYKTVVSPHTVTHAENEYVQAVCEWGLLGWVLLAGCVATGWLAFASAQKRSRDAGHFAGVTAALCAVAVHNGVDFNLETGGVGLPTVLLLGVVCANIPGKLRLGLRAPVVVGGVGAALLAMAISVVLAARGSLRADTERLAAAEELPTIEYLTVAAGVLKRHPADYLLPLTVGNRYLTPGPGRDGRNALYWTKRAMRLNPTNAEAHVLAARILLEMGKPELAVGEYQLARALDPRVARYPDAREFFPPVPLSKEEVTELVQVLVGRGTGRTPDAGGPAEGRSGVPAERTP